MVEETRLKVMDDKLVKHDEILNEVLTSQEELQYSNWDTGYLRVNPREELRQNRPQAVQTPTLKWELPYFEGHEPKVWIQKCERYFNLYKIPDNLKVEAATLYLNGLADTWYDSLVLSRGLVDEFLGKFEDLKAQMLIRNPHLDESHFISSFIGALKEEIRFGVKLFKPTTMRFVVERARLQEKAIEAAHKRTKAISKPSLVVSNPAGTRVQTAGIVKPNSFRLSREVYEYRKNNHLCYKCGEKYTQGHQCKKKQLNCMVGAVEDLLERQEIEGEQPNIDLFIEGELEQEVMEVVCMNALSGDNRGVNTTLVRGTIGNRKLTVLIDSGSTHSFIDVTTIKETSYQARHCPPLEKYVANYGVVCRPLTDLLKMDVFKWNAEADLAFRTLKKAITSTPVLSLPNYTKEFIVETDASHSGIGAVLMQEGRPIAYFSRVLAKKHRGKSIYEKEYMALLNAVDKWRHYLQYRHFVVRTDHHSLKYLLEQRVTSAIQQKGLTKLLGLDYEVRYKKGAKNRVVDALSRQQKDSEYHIGHSQGTLQEISVSVPSWMQEIAHSYEGDPTATEVISRAAVTLQGPNIWHYTSSILRKKGKIYIGTNGDLRTQLISTFHDSPVGGHSGQLGTLKRLDDNRNKDTKMIQTMNENTDIAEYAKSIIRARPTIDWKNKNQLGYEA
ncbi:hypothetical protein A4A49_38895 [Nicotiana attenuata]|uniref:Reverse transcriptase/retrotransposon-derived protein RNase H-like domain-containing protein n=1 Tax=Nicotiana attenuata TaxID=49451 RepID=A0A1J6KC68_NICAT|nr:hypothetical protein A4A49_38895 [Nicotiana attenuata]